MPRMFAVDAAAKFLANIKRATEEAMAIALFRRHEAEKVVAAKAVAEVAAREAAAIEAARRDISSWRLLRLIIFP